MQKLCKRGFAVVAVAVAGVGIAGLPAGSAATTAIFHHPRIRAAKPAKTSFGWASSNWSGYAATGSGFHAVTATWVVPSVTASRSAAYSSNWVGIDGFNNSSLIQTGTESDYYNGSAHYDAWWEILPAAETVIPSIMVKPGDTVSASIAKGSGSLWTITITDGKSYSTTQAYNGPQTSAEWIEEAPSIGGRVAPLANYGSTTFDPGTVNGVSPNLTASEGGVMVQKRAQVSTPSTPDNDADGFNIASGATVPAPPPS